MLERFNLNYGWQFLNYFNDEFSYSQNLKNSSIVDLPHTCKIIPYNNFDEKSLLFVSTYLKNIYISDRLKKNQIFLTFEGVMSTCEIYVNGNFAGSHFGGYTGFSIDITPYVLFNSNNTFVIKVDSNENKDVPPFGGVIDYLCYGGIYREAYMDVYGENHLKYVLISSQNKQIEINYIFQQESKNIAIDGEIIDGNGEVVSTFSFNGNIVDNELKYVHDFANAHLWSISDPYLYRLKTKFYVNNNLVDEKEDVFGIRNIKLDNRNIYINDEKIHLLGLNRHQSYPYVGYAMPKLQQYLDAEILKKKLNCNIVRSSHYPQSRHFYDRCDQLGLLVLIEVPGWQYIGNEKWQKNLLDTTKEMLFQNFNHPSIIIWGTRVNESSDNHQLYTKTNAIVKKYDKYRPTGGVRNFPNSDFLEDIYTYNDFVHSGNNQGISKPSKIYKKSVPILITEHNGHMYPVKKNDNILIRINHSLRHAKVINDSYKYKGIIGAIGWCMFDYNTHFQFGSGDRICYHGVLDMYRLPKEASYVYASQQDKVPYLEVASNFSPGDIPKMIYDKIVVYSNVDYLKLYKKDCYIGKFYKSSDFSKMKNPPIIIKDTVGEIMEKNEKFSHRDSNKIKNIMYKIVDGGTTNLSIFDKLSMFFIMKKYNLNIKDGERLFNDYFSTLNLENEYYTFVGYKNNTKVIEKKYGVSNNFLYRSEIDHDLLIEDETYDVSKIDIYKVNEYGMHCDYASDVIYIEVSGPIEIVGPSKLSLIGGSISTYIKSISKSGAAEINIYSNGSLISNIKLRVLKKDIK